MLAGKQGCKHQQAYLREEEVELEGVGVTGVFLRNASKKLTPLEIRLEKFRLRLRPKRGLKMGRNKY